MDNKCVFFLPTRKGSQRVIDKNTRPFSSFKGGILELKLKQLLEVRNIDRIILSTNDEKSKEIAKRIDRESKKIEVIDRPDELCLDSTNLVDLINYVPTITDSSHILWGHVTTPFAEAKDYEDALKVYFDRLANGYDSLISVTPFKNFLFKKNGELINNSSELKWPRTQDLLPLYEVNHAMFISSREVYLKNKNRIGDKPYFYEMNKIKSMDIDWEEDFKIAEAIYEKHFSA